MKFASFIMQWFSSLPNSFFTSNKCSKIFDFHCLMLYTFRFTCFWNSLSIQTNQNSSSLFSSNLYIEKHFIGHLRSFCLHVRTSFQILPFFLQQKKLQQEKESRDKHAAVSCRTKVGVVTSQEKRFIQKKNLARK